MFKTILVGTDGSEGAGRAVIAAAELASTQPDATLHIVTVQKPLSPTAMAASEMAAAAPVAAQMSWEEDIRHELERTLHNAADIAQHEAKLPMETHARFGNPAEVLCEMAEEIGADVIVVGNRGMRGARRFLGSVPNTVAHHAPCSVLIIDTV